MFPLQLLLPLDGEGYLRPAVLNWCRVTLHLVAALACYALCRDWRRSRIASLLAAVGFGCGGVWLRRPWASAGLAGFWLGLAWLSGHHEVPLLV